MNLQQLLKALPHGQGKQFAARVGTSYPYLYQVAHGIRTPSPDFCKRLVAADERLTLAELRPDIWAVTPPSNTADQTIANGHG
jgi:DNA-binding transcriptional regulator YdaS (Cro superfamily)